MLSGNGRHRRPRQAPALIVAAGVAGSALALPLLGAGSASAADAATWDRLAECESGGMWSADLGNGYYGGLQFSQEMWEEYGGLTYAPSADQASRSQQISVAEKVLDDQGVNAWRSCAPVAGLDEGGEAAEVDPGVPSAEPSADPEWPADESPLFPGASETPESSETPEPAETPEASETPEAPDDADASDDAGEKDRTEPDDSGEPDAPSEEDKSGDAEGKADESDRSESAPSDAPESVEVPTGEPTDGAADESGGRHRGDRAQESEPDRDGDSAGRHASRGDGAREGEGGYTVRSGDSLSLIADAHDLKGGWTALYERNKSAVGADPDLILPGQSLDLGLDLAGESDEK